MDVCALHAARRSAESAKMDAERDFIEETTEKKCEWRKPKLG